MTRVKFVYFKGSVTALFPDYPWAGDDITSYDHIGQHGAASKRLMRCKKATPAQYRTLLNELVTFVGYADLKVLNEVNYDAR